MSEKLLILKGSSLSELALSKELFEPTENGRISTGVGGPAITAAAAAKSAILATASKSTGPGPTSEYGRRREDRV